ncbi:hypothetical protein PENTCL1PPCAC_11835, partial [Pristionchus entomophagus]
STMIGRVKWENDDVKEQNGSVEGKMSLYFNAIDRYFASRKGKHDPIVTWEGNFWECTEDIHDYADFTIESLECVTRKVVRALRERITDSGRLLVLLPNVIQLPLTVLAAERLGIVPVIVNPISLTTDRLSSILGEIKPTLIVTLDGFFQGKNLYETKKLLDESIEKSKISSLKEILVIGHVGPRPGVPPPTAEYPGRRPSYSIQVPMSAGRDLEWSKVISSIDKDVHEKEVVWKGMEDTVFEYPIWKESGLTIASISMGTVLEWTDDMANKLSCGPSLLLSSLNDYVFTLVSLIASLVAGKRVVFYEGSIDYPDPARVSFIIKKYEVETLLIDSLSSLDKEYSSIVALPTLTTVISKEQTDGPSLFPSARHLSL